MRVYFVNVDCGPRTVPNRAIEYSISDCDWFRLSDGRSYFVASEEDPPSVYEKLQRVLHEEDNFIVCEVQAGGFAAFMATAAWDWVQKYFPKAVNLSPAKVPSEPGDS